MNNKLHTEFLLNFKDVKGENSEILKYTTFYEERILVRDLNLKSLIEKIGCNQVLTVIKLIQCVFFFILCILQNLKKEIERLIYSVYVKLPQNKRSIS